MRSEVSVVVFKSQPVRGFISQSVFATVSRGSSTLPMLDVSIRVDGGCALSFLYFVFSFSFSCVLLFSISYADVTEPGDGLGRVVLNPTT